MESTSSSYENTFYCSDCKREYPLSSKNEHISICKGLKSDQSDNNTIKEDCGVSDTINDWIDIHASQCFSQEDIKDEEKKSVQPSILKEEEDFEDLQFVLDQINLEKN